MPAKKTAKKAQTKKTQSKPKKSMCCMPVFTKGCEDKANKCSSGCGYFLGFLGAAIYYISTATSFWGGVLGFLKAIVWPVFLVYALMKNMGL